MFLLARPLQQRVLEADQLQEEVLGIGELRGGAADAAGDALQVARVQGSAAVVALVAAGAVEVAVGADALDVAVGQEAVVRVAVGHLHRALVDVAPLVEAREDVLGDFLVVLGVGGGEQVEGDSEPLPVVEKLGLVRLVDLFGGYAALLCGQGHGRAVGV